MGFFGNEDQNPSPEGVDNCEKALRKAGVETTFHLFRKTKVVNWWAQEVILPVIGFVFMH